MATVVKAPTTAARGVLVLTTQERNRAVNANPQTRQALGDLKERWLVGLHHNWHDHEFEYDDIFDFSMAGEGDLIERSGRKVPLVTLDACNFVPQSFAEQSGDRFWDVLYVARPVFFKGMPEFLKAVRTLYDRGAQLRILCLCPIPPYVAADRDTVIYDLPDQYLASFSEDERRLFNLWTIAYDYPFPLDLETLAHFYRSAKVFVHFAEEERRCRVAAYAWTQGIPVVAMKSVGSLLPGDMQRPPYFFEVDSYEEFPDRILEALAAPAADLSPARRHFVESQTTDELKIQLAQIDGSVAGDREGWALGSLNLRLGRHHGIGEGPNTVPQDVGDLLRTLGDEAGVREAAAHDDPEAALARTGSDGRTSRSSGRWRQLFGR